jgi:Asp-tRNA(Asn)/Glu-tRNA(Gln) amidotransferase A subunit family amidase
MARTVSDLALMWDVIGRGTEPTEAARRSEAPRLGRLRGLFDSSAEAPMRQALDHALDALARQGATVSEPALPDRFSDVIAFHRCIMASEAAAWHEARIREHPDDYRPRISELINEGLATPAIAYVRARQHQERLKSEILGCFEDVDALVAPATPGPAPDRSSTGNPVFNSPWSYTGLPTISFPIALDREGLPLAIQLVGRPRGELSLFGTAIWCEAALRSSAHGRENR